MASAELFEDPFDPDEYVERLAWRTPGGGTKGGASGFNPNQLYNEFVGHIKELQLLDSKIQKKVERLENSLENEARAHTVKVTDLQRSNQVAFSHFQSLDDRINYVATKVVHLGDQLEGVNTPRAHAAEALKLMKYFDEFLSGEFTSEIFVNPYQVREAADVVQKLHLIAQELPYDRFAKVKGAIVSKYHSIEQELLAEFKEAHRDNEVEKMKNLAATLSHFKGYQYCIDAFIEESILNSFYNRNEIFSEISNLCSKVHKLIVDVFSSPEQVLGKLVSKVYQTKLHDHVHNKLREHRNTDPERFLQNLHMLYGKTNDLSENLSKYKLGSDSHFLHKLTKGIFKQYLDEYISIEENFLREKATLILQRFYDSKNHTKRQLHSGNASSMYAQDGFKGIQDLKAAVMDKTNIRFGMGANASENQAADETFLSQELAINLLQETKMGFVRCKTLSSVSNLPTNSTRIFLLLMEFLCKQHIEYAIDLGLTAIPSSEPKMEPNIYFLDVVQQTNTVFHLFEKQFNDTLLPLVSSSPKYSDCIQNKKKIRETMEIQLDTGIDKCLLSIIGWMKNILKSEQKRNDFSTDLPPQQQCTNACSILCKYVKKAIEAFMKSLDGNNVDAVMKEFGTRLHRTIYEHLQQYSFSSMGGMMAICDVNEYSKCAENLKQPFVKSLFESLHSLCNLLVVAPENLRQVCSGDQFANLDRGVLHSFVQLRSDYKSSRLGRIFT